MRPLMRLLLPPMLCIALLALAGMQLPVASVAQAAKGMPPFGFSPQQYQNTLTYGIGVYFAPPTLTLYATPEDTQPPVDVIQWTPDSRSVQVFSHTRQQPVPASTLFLSYYPTLRMAAMAVVSDNGAGWAEVVADQRTGKTAWVKLREKLMPEADQGQWPRHLAQFQPWLDFIKYNTVASGVYWLNGVSSYDRAPRMRPEDGSKFVEIQIVRRLNVKFARGNWLLVEVMDLDRTTPIGWVRWRDDAGRLMVFPNFSGQSTPILLGGF